MFSGSPGGTRPSRCSLLWSLMSHCSLQCSTADGPLLLPFLCTHFFPCYSVSLSRPSPLISICGNPNHLSSCHSAVPPPSTFPNHPQPLSWTPHLYHVPLIWRSSHIALHYNIYVCVLSPGTVLGLLQT